MRVLSASLAFVLASLGIAAGGQAPVPLADNPKLVYPEAARRFGVTGEISFAAQVDDKGRVTSVDVRSVPMPKVGFEEAVKATVSGWRFAPAVVDGKPSAGTYAAVVNFRLRPPDEADITRVVEQLAAAWNGRQVDGVVRQFDLGSVPAAAMGRNGMRGEADLRTWVTEQMPAAPAPLKPAPRVVRFAGASLAYVEVPLEPPAGAPPAAPLFGMMVKRNNSWRLVRLDWSEAPGQTPVRAGLGGNIQEPRKVKHVTPSYPDSLLQSGIRGTVILECIIDTEGNVTDVQVVSGHTNLAKLAKDAVQKWRYTPTLLDGVPVPVIMTVTVNFRTQ